MPVVNLIFRFPCVRRRYMGVDTSRHTVEEEGLFFPPLYTPLPREKVRWGEVDNLFSLPSSSSVLNHQWGQSELPFSIPCLPLYPHFFPPPIPTRVR